MMRSTLCRKIYFLLFLFVASMYGVFAQNTQFFYASRGLSLASEVIITAGKVVPVSSFEDNYQQFHINMVAFHTPLRVNIIPISESAVLSFSLHPTIGAGVSYAFFETGSWYSLGGSLPVYLDFNYGLASRYFAPQSYGIACGVGYEYSAYPLVCLPISYNDIPPKDMRKTWTQLSSYIAFRFYNSTKRVKEINFRVGIGDKGKEFITFGNYLQKEKLTCSFKLSYITFINF